MDVMDRKQEQMERSPKIKFFEKMLGLAEAGKEKMERNNKDARDKGGISGFFAKVKALFKDAPEVKQAKKDLQTKKKAEKILQQRIAENEILSEAKINVDNTQNEKNLEKLGKEINDLKKIVPTRVEKTALVAREGANAAKTTAKVGVKTAKTTGKVGLAVAGVAAATVITVPTVIVGGTAYGLYKGSKAALKAGQKQVEKVKQKQIEKLNAKVTKLEANKAEKEKEAAKLTRHIKALAGAVAKVAGDDSKVVVVQAKLNEFIQKRAQVNGEIDKLNAAIEKQSGKLEAKNPKNVVEPVVA